ncbi:hypothetical protein B0H66DRAFT_226552 [Apodospora peruviana]|uniref:Uncharacterized protein n=1 Tax=Apodospora peruviana TaxID=516989 RepID=A0AAE0I407_9PEZI|nr:hypothetical protein B0H66DRAFT_226552 [Apodospora peruviana]
MRFRLRFFQFAVRVLCAPRTIWVWLGAFWLSDAGNDPTERCLPAVERSCESETSAIKLWCASLHREGRCRQAALVAIAHCAGAIPSSRLPLQSSLSHHTPTPKPQRIIHC